MWKSMSGGGCCCSIKSAVKVSAVMFMHHDIIKKNPLVLSRSLNDLDKLHIIFCCATTITLTASIGIKIWSNSLISCCFSKWKHLKVCALWSWGFRCVLNTIPQLPKSGSQKPYPKVRPCNQTLQASFSMLNFKVLNGKIRKRPNKHDFYHVLKWHFFFYTTIQKKQQCASHWKRAKSLKPVWLKFHKGNDKTLKYTRHGYDLFWVCSGGRRWSHPFKTEVESPPDVPQHIPEVDLCAP